MSKQLKISTVRVSKFGGLKDLTRKLPTSNLITIFGSNEAGKSTLAEVIMWLIAGPTGDSSHIRRFGEPTEALIAQLDGQLGEEELLLKSEFRVLKGSVSVLSPFSAQIGGGGSLTREQWLSALGNSSLESIHAVHRIDGASGHLVAEGEQVLDLASKGMFGGVDPRRVTDSLTKQARALSTTASAGTRSVRNITAQANTCLKQLEEAGKNADQYLALKQEQAENAELLAKSISSKNDLAAQIAALGSASKTHKLLLKKQASEQSLNSIDAVGHNWAAMVNHIPDLQSLLRFSRDKQPELNAQIRLGEDTAHHLGQTVQQLAALSFTDADLLNLNNCVTNLVQSQGAEGKSQSDLDVAESALPQATHAQAQALETLGQQVTAETVRLANLGADSRGLIQGAASQVKNAITAITSAQSETREATGRVQVAEAALQRALDHWQQFDTGLTAESWLISGKVHQSQPAQGLSSAGFARFIPAVLFAALAAAALVLTQPIIGILAAVGLIITLVLAFRTQDNSASTTVTTQSDLSAATEAANAVAQAVSNLQQQRTNLDTRQGNQLRAEQDRSSAVAALQDALQDAGLPTVTNPAEVASVLDAYQHAQTVVEHKASAQQRLAQAQHGFQAATLQSQAHLDALRGQLDALHLPRPEPLTDATHTFTTFRSAADLAKQAVIAQRSVQLHQQQVYELCQAVLQPGQAIDLAGITAQTQQCQASLQARKELTTQIIQQDLAIQEQIGGSEKVQRLVSRYLTTDEFTTAQTELQAKLDSAQADADGLTTRSGGISQRLEDLSKEGQIAKLNQSLTALTEERSEAAVQAAVLAVAAGLLSEQANLADQKNQPKLIERSSALACSVAPTWKAVRVERDSDGSEHKAKLLIDLAGGGSLAAHKLSTGARAVLYLALRLAVAEDQSERTRVWLPLICDDPLVHLDDTRAPQAMALLAQASKQRQVILLTCNDRTRDFAEFAGAQTMSLTD